MLEGVLIIHGVDLVDKEFQKRPGLNAFDQITQKLDYFFSFAAENNLHPVICGRIYGSDVATKSIRKSLLYFKDKKFSLFQEKLSGEKKSFRRSMELLLSDFDIASLKNFGDVLNLELGDVVIHNAVSEASDNTNALKIVLDDFEKIGVQPHSGSVALSTRPLSGEREGVYQLNKLFRLSPKDKGPQMASVTFDGDVSIIEIPHQKDVFALDQPAFKDGSLLDNSEFAEKLRDRIKAAKKEQGNGFISKKVESLPEVSERDVFMKGVLVNLYNEVSDEING